MEQFEVTKKIQADAMFDADMMPFTSEESFFSKNVFFNGNANKANIFKK